MKNSINRLNRLYDELIDREDYLIHLMSGGSVKRYVDSFYLYDSSHKILLVARIFSNDNIQVLNVKGEEVYYDVYEERVLCDLLIDELKKVMV